MTELEFWTLLESTSQDYESSASLTIHSQALLKVLNEKTDTELSEYDSYMRKFVEELNFYELWAVAWLIPNEGGSNYCSDDSFEDFRAGIIARGRDVFGRAKENPDSLEEVKEAQLLKGGEVFLLAAQAIYTDRYGIYTSLEYIPEIVGPGGMPRGVDWNLEDYPSYFTKRFPKSIAKGDCQSIDGWSGPFAGCK